MKYMLAILALAASISAQSFTDEAGNTFTNPPGCTNTYTGGEFQIANVNQTGPGSGVAGGRSINGCSTEPIATLINANLSDAFGTGEIVANEQFQFDPSDQLQGPTVLGWSVCEDHTLAIRGDNSFYSCNSGSFNNLYKNSIADYCYPIFLKILPCTGDDSSVVPEFRSTDGSSGPEASGSSSSDSTSTTSSTSSATAAPVAPVTSAMASVPAAPYPVGNDTTPVATGSAIPSSTSLTTSTSATATPFTGAADALAVGSKLVAAAAGLAVIALF